MYIVIPFLKFILTGAGMTLPFPVGKWKGLTKESASARKYCELLKLVLHENSVGLSSYNQSQT